MKKNNGIKRKKLIPGILLFSIIILSGVGTYAFFSSETSNNKNLTATIKMGTLALTFEDNDNGINKKMSLGETVTKKFKIINTGTLDASLSLDWNMLVNTYLNRSLSYNLKYSTEENGTYEEIVPETNMPTSTKPIKQALASELSVPAGATYYYNLEITLNHLENINQTDDVNAVFNTKFDIGEPSKYRYYRLTIDTNRGSFEEEIQKEYLLKNEETVSISNIPTRPGYTFAGWKVQGLSSKFVDGIFTMGISDTYMIAQWIPIRYSLIADYNCDNDIRLDPDGNSGTITVTLLPIYLETVKSLNAPVCEGYTFTGWNVTEGAGTITGNTTDGYTFTLTEPGNATIEAQWTPNNYKYIVYHNQMNIDGNGYTLVEADTDEGEAAFNTTVTPTTKEYRHFTAPNTQTLTIKHETVYPPVLNKVEYNYERNKYTVTLNANGGEYEGKQEIITEYYYWTYVEAYMFSIPTRTGYNFYGWADNPNDDNLDYLGGIRLTRNETFYAHWTAKNYSVTFNANGGSTPTTSKAVTYDSAYGELPTPTYEGYTFEGWYTEANGGTKVTSTTMYTTADNTTLYAHWKEIEKFNVPEAVLAIKNNQTPKLVNGVKSSFVKAATTDEGVFEMPDDYGTSYYFRGAATNNYVKFGGFYWRIIRVNGDGSVRMIYDGTRAYVNRESSTDRFIKIGQVYNELYADAKYVGWMYGAPKNNYSTSITNAQANQINSDLKMIVDTWYVSNIEKNAANSNKNLDRYIADSVFCNDRSMSSTAQQWWADEGTIYRGFRTTSTAYGAFGRFLTTNVDWNKANPTPRFTCPQENDMFTVSSQTINGKTTNGMNTKKIGLITADEIITAGGVGEAEINNSYLLKNSSLWYWTMTPMAMDYSNGAFVFGVDQGNLGYTNVDTADGAVAPVINISADYAKTMVGNGTMDSPYQIPGVE